MAITSNQEIAVTGYCENAFGGTEFMTLLYSSSGNPLWCQIKQGENELGYAEGKDVTIGSNGDILVTGFVEEDGIKKFRTAAIGIDGRLKWQKIFTTPQKDSRGGRILTSGDDIIVTG